MWRERGGEDAAPKDTAFLPLRASMCTHRFAEYKECSRMISLVNTSREKTLEEGLALFLYSLAGDPKGGGQLLFPASNLQRLPMKRQSVQLDSIVDR